MANLVFLNGISGELVAYRADDSTIALRCDMDLLTTGAQVVWKAYSIAGSHFLTGATTEGSANQVLLSGGGSGSTNTWADIFQVAPNTVIGVNRTGLGAAVSATNLISSTSIAGFYRVSWVATVTQAATTSSVLGGSLGFQLIYTNQNDSVVKTSNPQATGGMTSTGNTTGDQVSGVLCAFCAASTALKYAFDYTSVGGTVMQYDLSIKVEYLGA